MGEPHVPVTDAYGTYYYIDSASSKDVLTWAEMKQNATYIYTYCARNMPTWTLNAISAMLGNFQHEGIMNPSQWEYGYRKSLKHGYGLGQWTPATKLLDWLTGVGIARTAISGQMDRIAWEAANGQQWIPTKSYPMSFTSFLTSTDAVATLASAWLYDWERPKYPTQTEAIRRASAETWYEYLSGVTPDPPDPPGPGPHPSGRKGMPLYFYPAFRYGR